MLQLIFVVFNCYLYRNKPLRFSLFIVALTLVSGWILETLNVLRLGKNCSTGSATLFLGNLSLNFTLSSNQIYHHKAVAYDYYSMSDIRQSKVGDQWRIWALPHEQVQLTNNTLVYSFEVSPSFLSNLPFVNTIYVITNPSFVERHDNLKKALQLQGIGLKSIEWRMKWNRTTCNSESSHSYVYKRLNLKNVPLGKYACTRLEIIF